MGDRIIEISELTKIYRMPEGIEVRALDKVDLSG